MHMNSVPHLLAEDRPDFERILDQALRTAAHDPELNALAAATGRRLTAEQLRTMAIGAMAAISACAMAEYQDLIEARRALRDRAPSGRPQPVGGPVPAGEDAAPPAGPPPEESPGAGAAAVLVVLAPVLAGIAAILFLAIGYVLRTAGSDAPVAGSMITIGWWFGGLTAVGVLAATTGILLTALRNGAPTEDDDRRRELAEQADRAREAWRGALLERGIRPFLKEAQANATAPAPRSPSVPPARNGHSRTPHLGYTRPGFTSPDEDHTTPTRPRFTSPDFTGPDFGRPDRRRE
ncbi:hypothetical protein [Streptomyces morookaense]|uniref:Transmembrane protein n=2 Tax=Streptomyces morookaense TaxID=1970 RepID=A0A7Y7B0C9_STRMO|nr:hypothetical protein [Streptomyces morookaense]NVK76731.1 hypothetical protein [Streptomyces morookaense]GHF26849.1 membrane protein [Streptomyces morookaense]